MRQVARMRRHTKICDALEGRWSVVDIYLLTPSSVALSSRNVVGGTLGSTLSAGGFKESA